VTRKPLPTDLIVHAMAVSEAAKIIRQAAVYLEAPDDSPFEAAASEALAQVVREATANRLTAQQTIFIMASLIVNTLEPESAQAWLNEQGAALVADLNGYEDDEH